MPRKASALQFKFSRIEGLMSATKSEHYLGVFHGIFQNFPNNYLQAQHWRNASERKKKEVSLLAKDAHRLMLLQLLLFSMYLFIIMKKSLSTIFGIGHCNLDYFIYFYEPKKGLISLAFTSENLLVKIFGCY